MDGYNENVELVTNFVEDVEEEDVQYWLQFASFNS